MMKLKKYPLIGTFLLWLFFFLSFGYFKIDGVVPVSYILSMAMAGAAVYFRTSKKEKIRKVPKEKRKAPLYMLGAVVYTALMMYTFDHVRSSPAIRSRNDMIPFFFLTALMIAYCIAVSVKKKWSEKRIVFVMVFFSSVLHLFFMMSAKFNLTQWDMGEFFTDGHGHAGYIEYLYHHNLIPPPFDPREKWQYYHPPLHHILEAVFLKIQTLCGADMKVAVQNIQYPTMLYAMLVTVCSYLIFKELKLRKLPLIIATAVMAFSPALMYVGLFVNNDMLSILFVFLCILFTIRWYKKPTVKNILKIAVSFGLGMLSKMSAALIAPSVAVIFLYALVRKLKEKEYRTLGRYLGQMFAFLGVAAPISLYWSFRNFVRFGVPFGYVPESLIEIQYIPETAVRRMFDFDFKMFVNPYINFKDYGDDFNEYNPLVALLKSSASEMGTIRFVLGVPIGYILFWSTLTVAAAASALMIYVLLKKNSMAGIGKVFFTVTYLVYIVSFEYFCIKYPYICTENIRYALPVVFVGAVFLGIGIREISGKRSKSARLVTYGTSGMVFVFSLASMLMITAYGIVFTVELMML